jgi:hypothetical protein
MDKIKLDNKINIYLGSLKIKILKRPIEKINIYQGKLFNSYILKELYRKESNNLAKNDINNILNEKKSLFVTNNFKKFPIISPRVKETKLVPQEMKSNSKKKIIIKNRNKSEIINHMEKKDFYY